MELEIIWTWIQSIDWVINAYTEINIKANSKTKIIKLVIGDYIVQDEMWIWHTWPGKSKNLIFYKD